MTHVFYLNEGFEHRTEAILESSHFSVKSAPCIQRATSINR